MDTIITIFIMAIISAAIGIGTVIFADYYMFERRQNRMMAAIKKAFGITDEGIVGIKGSLKEMGELARSANAWWKTHGKEIEEIASKLASMAKSFMEEYPEKAPKRIVIHTVKVKSTKKRS